MIYCFTKNTFEKALDEWIKEGLHNHPEQKERIEITAVAMKIFMQSDKMQKYKMAIQTNT